MNRITTLALSILALSLNATAHGEIRHPGNPNLVTRQGERIHKYRVNIKITKRSMKEFFRFSPKLEIKRQVRSTMDAILPLSSPSALGQIVIHDAAVIPHQLHNSNWITQLYPPLSLKGQYSGNQLDSLQQAVKQGNAKIGVYGNKSDPRKATVSIRWEDGDGKQSIKEVIALGQNKKFVSGTRGGKLSIKSTNKEGRIMTVKQLADFEKFQAKDL